MRSLAFFITLFSSGLSACAAGDDGLEAIQADILSEYKDVTQMSPREILALNEANTLILDIREPEEYAVSRIPGAIWVNPNANAETAFIQIGDVSGKNIIVYCSVGVRSSRFAQRVQMDLLEMGASSVANLEKGIFGWHNERRDLVDAKGATDAIHPYDGIWKRYVDRKDQARYAPLAKTEEGE